jgi:hypothetical protein
MLQHLFLINVLTIKSVVQKFGVEIYLRNIVERKMYSIPSGLVLFNWVCQCYVDVFQQDSQYTYNVILRGVRATAVVVKKK